MQRSQVELSQRLTSSGIHSRQSAHIHIAYHGQQQLEARLAGSANGSMKSCRAIIGGDGQVRDGQERSRALRLLHNHCIHQRCSSQLALRVCVRPGGEEELHTRQASIESSSVESSEAFLVVRQLDVRTASRAFTAGRAPFPAATSRTGRNRCPVRESGDTPASNTQRTRLPRLHIVLLLKKASLYSSDRVASCLTMRLETTESGFEHCRSSARCAASSLKPKEDSEMARFCATSGRLPHPLSHNSLHLR